MEDIALNASLLSDVLVQLFPEDLLANLSFLFAVGKTIGILAIIYLTILIIRAIIQTRQALRIKSIEQAVVSIDKKLDHLIGKKSR